ncbi:C-3 sterol dehydrogenase [Crepidotus variabilis]|uniref:C-3 sterol dehydrogenase n=1 Tax=Crepidotus variabilis TaxID=179855 RepID=A0A9P6EED3_9AGAR|nr:C-3 sterol dehydrogenase [Crepidotus variabilis]
MAQDKKRDVYLVIGGNGFLGRHIVQQLQERGDIVSAFDIVERYNDVTFYAGDITDQNSVASALRKSGATCVIHTASPLPGSKDVTIFHRVNVKGTEAVIAACVECSIRKLVFTSSAGVIFNGEDIINADERQPFPEVPMDAYNETKSQAETLVLEANGKGGLLTVALRPAGIFGPLDRQAISSFAKVFLDGKTHFQIGDNTNLFDWTYVGNVAHAHLLAADKLETPAPAPALSTLSELPVSTDDVPSFTNAERTIIDVSLPPISHSTSQFRIPTCEARPLGPYVDPPTNGDKILASFNDPSTLQNRPVIRSRFDQLSDQALKRTKIAQPDINPLQVAGQVFFITNGEPVYFWDFPRKIWAEMDKLFPGKRQPRKPTVLPKAVGFAIASVSEGYSYVTGQEVTFNKFKVTFTCATRYHNIEKARRILGYEPVVGVDEGVKRAVAWWHSDYLATQQQKSA